jgi:uncharacterized protein (TIGR03086 family)
VTLPEQPAARHRAIADAFTELVRGVPDWEAPSPVPGWAARDVVDHLVTWFPAFLAGGSEHRVPAGPPTDQDPVAAWVAHSDGVQALLEDPVAAASTFRHPYVPEQDLATTISSFYTADVFMHSWDLARASGQQVALDGELSRELLEGMRSMESVLRESGQYGPAHEVSPDAPVQDQLVAFIGRDPAWRP